MKRTPLQEACEMGSYPVVEFLLSRGARVNDPPALRCGGTALQLACISGSPRIVDLLLDRQADLHAAPSAMDGRTALEGAAEHGRIAILDMLWDKAGGGFEPAEIERAQEFARANGNTGCAEHLAALVENSLWDVGRLPSLMCF